MENHTFRSTATLTALSKTSIKSDEILARQGSSLLIDVIAESIGETVNKFKLNSVESKRIRDSLVSELNDAISERT